jgi:hypothetical protein
MNTLKDFLNFLRIFHALRYGSLDERKAIHESEADTKFIVAITEAGLFDGWLEIAESTMKKLDANKGV